MRMLQTVGLFTFIRNTRIKTIALLFAYLLIALLVSFAFSLMLAIVYTPGLPEVKFAAAVRMFALEWHRMLGGAILWAALASVFFRKSVNKSVEAVGIERSAETRLLNIVENLAISTGLPVPQVHIIVSAATNAFMSGLTPSRMSLTVTRGMLKRLDDEQIKAVLAHEFVLAMTGEARRLGLASVFASICIYFALMIVKPFYKRGVSMLIVLLALPMFPYEVATVMVVAVLAAVLGAITLKLMVGKLRVFVGDAGSLELTKNPEALVSAVQIMSRQAVVEGANFAIRPLLFVDPTNGWFSMHPSADERIAAIRTYVPTVKVPAAPTFSGVQSSSFGLRDQLSVPSWVSGNAILVPLVAFAIYCGFTTRWTSVDPKEVQAHRQDIQLGYEFALTGMPESYRSMALASAKALNETYDLNLDMDRLNSITPLPPEAMAFQSGKMTPANALNPIQEVRVGDMLDAMEKNKTQHMNFNYGGGVVQFSADGTVKQLDNITRPIETSSGDDVENFNNAQTSIIPPGMLRRMKETGVSPDVIALYEQQFQVMLQARSNSRNQNGSESAIVAQQSEIKRSMKAMKNSYYGLVPINYDHHKAHIIAAALKDPNRLSKELGDAAYDCASRWENSERSKNLGQDWAQSYATLAYLDSYQEKRFPTELQVSAASSGNFGAPNFSEKFSMALPENQEYIDFLGDNGLQETWNPQSCTFRNARKKIESWVSLDEIKSLGVKQEDIAAMEAALGKPDPEPPVLVNAASPKSAKTVASSPLTPELEAFERISNASWNKGTSGLSTVAIPALILFVFWRILAGIGGLVGRLRRMVFAR
jgi:heat shock protein HtpX